ncbi:LacI family DNA-binding transcriptional regulator [Ochrobactrum vermis]|uniref:LacI family DNA-binding transcriptional regulator n=1 Tax=Ochrobactrum vermis TaxID=1827297 RepID=A0ABU8PHS2_9HYPH|nr:LacI family DNA-binding transcriptional regulator [Ochrobactrum vermis]PQZ26110.1 LacI family transcriptional regulator [Ochrobactrum vermis]
MPSDDRKKSRVTLLDVARHADVSRATASLVIRKSPLVGAATREKVEKALRDLGYVYNMGAASLRVERSNTVGVIVPTLGNPFYGELLSGIDGVVGEAGMVVLLANSHENFVNQSTLMQRMREHGVDGVIISLTAETAPEFIEQIADWGLPVVQVLRHVTDRVDYAGVDYAGGMRQAVNHLAMLGHKAIAFAVHGPVHSAYRERVEGFRDAMQQQGLDPAMIVRLPHTMPEIASAAPLLFQDGRKPTAAICFNDVVALGLSAGLYDCGRKIGDDFSLIGFDDVSDAEATRPRLSSVSTRPVTVGQNAATLLLSRLANPEKQAQRIVSETYLQVRQSCGPVKTSVV